MAKFYVTSADVQLMVQAEDAQGAALWAIHQTLERAEAINCSEQMVIDADSNPLLCWDETTLVSERGFGHHDAGCFSTEQLIQRYFELTAALERLCERVFS